MTRVGPHFQVWNVLKKWWPSFFVIQFVSAIFDIISENVFQIYFLGARNIEFAQGLKMLRPTLVTQ